MHEHVITEHEASQRLDRFLRKLLPDLPLGAIFKHLRQGSIRVDERKVDGALRLEPGMRVQLRRLDLAASAAARPGSAVAAAAAAAGPLPPAGPNSGGAAEAPRVVHHDEAFLVVAKPAGLAVHGGSGITHSVVDWLANQPFGVRSGTFRPAAAHRIDRGTSGLLLIGLTPHALRMLTAAFRDGAVKKVYHAVVGGVPKQRTGSIAAPLLVDQEADHRGAKVRVDARGQSAHTDYEVVRSRGGMTLIKVMPREGRQHQIRAHLAHLGHPIVGDRRYGARAGAGKGFLLHCSELTFPHPVTAEPMRFVAPLPPAFTQLFGQD